MSKSFTRSITLLTFLITACIAMALGQAKYNAKGSEDKCVRFPTKEALRASLCQAGFDQFVKKTQIEEIADYELVPLGVAMILEQKLYDYNKYMQEGVQDAKEARTIEILVQMTKFRILKILLQKDPAALEVLAEGLYKGHKIR